MNSNFEIKKMNNPVECKSIKVVDIQARGLFLARRSQRLRRTGSGYEADDFDEVRL